MRFRAWACCIFFISAALQADPPAVAEAIRDGDIGAVKVYLGAGHSVNSPAGEGHLTLLSLAVEARQEAMVEFLIAQGADVNLHDQKPGLLESYDGVTPLDQAARNNDLGAAKTLIAHGASVNPVGDDPFGPLINASIRRSLDVAELLLAKGADENQADANGDTALHHAARKGLVDMMELLLTHGAKPDRADHKGDMPLGSAFRAGQFAAARALIGKKLPCDHLDLQDHSLLDLALMSPAASQVDGGLIDLLRGCGMDLNGGKRLTLWYAINNGQAAAARILIQKGADVSAAPPSYGEPLLQLVVRKALGPELLDELVKKGLDVNALNSSGQPPLLTLDLAHTEPTAAAPMFDYLLAHGASIKASDRNGYTLLHYAARTQANAGVWVNYLINKGADINAKSSNNLMGTGAYAPIHVAAMSNNVDAIEALAGHGADLNSRTDDKGQGPTALQLAASDGKLEAVKALVAHGADVNARSNVPLLVHTALSAALVEQHFDCAKWLLQHGADASGVTSALLEIAMNQREYQLAQELKARGAQADSVDLRPRPPAFFGGGCDKAGPVWDTQNGPVAEVIGQPEKLHLHPDYPPNCGIGSKSCDGKAYVVAGDRVVIGAHCGAWTDVQFSGSRSTSWGWVESARLKVLGTADKVSLGHHAPVAAAPPGLCEAARSKLDDALLHREEGSTPFAAVPLNFKDVKKLPPALQQEADDFESTSIADAVIRGVQAKVVVRSSGGTCATGTFDIWTHDFKKQMYGDSDDAPFVREELENYGGDTYLVASNSQNHDVVLFGFTPVLESAQLCSFSLVSRQPQQVLEAVDPELCSAIRDGKAEQVLVGDDQPVEVAAEALGSDQDVPGGQWHYMLGPKVLVDIYNDGHPLPVAMATGDASSGAGCGHEYQTAWPVVLGKDDMPDRSLKKIEAEDEQARLIRYHGTIYVETSSADGSSSHDHDVWKASRNGVTKMCSFLPVRYGIK